MFRGITAINIDNKGRMVIPTRYRDVFLAAKKEREYPLVVTIDTESPCLLLYPMKEWEIIETKLQGLSSFNQASRRIQRLLLGHATELELDANGRILLPTPLRDYATLDKAIILVGQGKKFEIWAEAKWHEHRQVWLAEGSRTHTELPVEIQELSL